MSGGEPSLFGVLTGSRMRGYARPDSDTDRVVIHEGARTRQRADAHGDVTYMALGHFQRLLDGGDYLAAEILFTPGKEYTPRGEAWRAWVESLRPPARLAEVARHHSRALVRRWEETGKPSRAILSVMIAVNAEHFQAQGSFRPDWAPGDVAELRAALSRSRPEALTARARELARHWGGIHR